METSITLDKKDSQLLYLLDLDGRLTYSELAKKLRISKQVAKYRVERLEEKDIIKGYYPMIDISKLGYITFRTYIKLRNATPTTKQEIITFLTTQENIWAVVHLAGNWDIALGISVKNIYEYYTTWEKILNKYLPHIKDYKTSIYSPIYHYSKAYLTGTKDHTKIRILGGGKQEPYDSKDAEILRKLAKNARTSLIEIGKTVQLSPELVSYRIKQLQKKGIIQGYRAMIDVEKLGYQSYKAEIRLSRYNHVKELPSYCHQHPSIYQVDKTIGGETFEIEFHVHSIKEMQTIIENIEETFPKTIESYEYITILDEEKITYMPEG